MSNKNYWDNTNARAELIGFPNILSPFSQFVSGSRADMFNNHATQAMVLNKPEFNKIFTGLENNFLDYTFNRSRREHDCEILDIIPKYEPSFLKGTIDDCPTIHVITLTMEPNGERKLDYFDIDRYFMGTNGFGWIPQLDPRGRSRIRKGEILDKETVITHSPREIGNQYAIGTNLNVVVGSFPETLEDAFVISESAAEKLKTTQIFQRVLNFKADRRPLNLYGEGDAENFLPDIGSHVRFDGALCASRPVHWTTIAADTDPESLRNPLPLQDDIIYAPAGAKVVDLTFNINRKNINNCYPQAMRYMQNSTVAWMLIYEIYLKYKNKYELTPKMSTLVTTAIYRLLVQDSPGRNTSSHLSQDLRKLAKHYTLIGADKNEPVDFMQVIVTYAVEQSVKNGDKLTDQAGTKGVVGAIYPDEWMPTDEYGFRADVMIDMTSPVARNNPGQLYEMGINRIAEFARRKVKATYDAQGSEVAWTEMMDFFGDINPNYRARLEEVCVTPQSRKDLVKDMLENGFRLWIPPFMDGLTPSDKDFWNSLSSVKRWADKWECKNSRITYTIMQKNGIGKTFTTEDDFSIGSKYMIRLNKIPEQTAPGFARVNHMGVPTKNTFENKNFPISISPYRLGEDETRMMNIDAPAVEVARLLNLQSNSPYGVNASIQSILTAQHPTRIKRIPVSSGNLWRTSAIANVFHSISATLGLQTKTTKQDITWSDDEARLALQKASEEALGAVDDLFSDNEK